MKTKKIITRLIAAAVLLALAHSILCITGRGQQDFPQCPKSGKSRGKSEKNFFKNPCNSAISLL
ncbi:MAG: hypothetical protein ACI4GO_01680 [Hominenteromicrobium sp.]